MNKKELIACFQDTLNVSYSRLLKNETDRAEKSNRVYQEGFVSKRKACMEQAEIIVEENTTFAAANKYRKFGKTAVLNFANPVNPAGGVQNGAMAQEECLCRSSNLYCCLSSSNVEKDFYTYHRGFSHHFYSDRLIYTKDVTVFKDDSTIPVLMEKKDWFTVDVITCSAPYLAKQTYTSVEALSRLFKCRIRNILEAAKDNGVEVIILGAFGCGAFKNPPLVVAEAFWQVICEENYVLYFKKIVFAIKRTGERCQNLDAFYKQFSVYSPSQSGQTHGISPVSLKGRFRKIPQFLKQRMLLDIFNDQYDREQEFSKWQEKNRYFGKQFSILGDSLSTLTGYNPEGYEVYYQGENCAKTGVNEMEDTWWEKVIAFFGGELLVNNSYSGSRVTKMPGKKQLFPSACSEERTSTLHVGDVMPDVIIVYMGMNDWGYGVATDTVRSGADENERLGTFQCAYESMLKKLKKNYPNSEIWCCSLSETCIVGHPEFVFPYECGGTHMREYNRIIGNVSCKNECKFINLHGYQMPYETKDGTHATNNGMTMIAKIIIRETAGEEGSHFIDCDNKEVDVAVKDEPEVEEGSIVLDTMTTTELFSDILKLTRISDGETMQFQKKEVSVGRSQKCDWMLNTDGRISRLHAHFLFEGEKWFVCDNFSTNGTWLNGVRMESGKKYELVSNDEIDFAGEEKVIFNWQVQREDISEDEMAKMLEAAIQVFAESNRMDGVALKLIMIALSEVPLYFPVEIDVEAMFGSIDPVKLKAGDILKPQKDVKMRILTMTLENGMEFVPVFTSKEEADKGPDASTVRYYPQDYLPMLIQMDKTVLINPFSKFRFPASMEWVKTILLPFVQSNKGTFSAAEPKKEQQDKYIEKVIEEKYRVLKLIGRGGTFSTYLVQDNRVNMKWAMKVADKKDKHYSLALRSMILQEPYIMMKLNHPAIPKVVDIIEDDESICIIREYIEGESLAEILKREGAQPPEKVVEWSKQLCDMLRYMHNLTPPYIYRDMKPANVILMPNGRIKVIDFGITIKYDVTKKRDACCLGTKGYAAPEQYEGRSEVRTDIFGLGMTMHYLVTGVNPTEPPYETKPICEINPNLPKGLEYIISKCIQKEPEMRYQNCDALMADLDSYLSLPKQKKGIFGKF